MLNNHDLTYMRGEIEKMLPDYCTILNPTNVPDGQGGFTQTWGTIAANVKCRLDNQRRGYEAIEGGAIQPFDFWILTLPYDTTIAEEYRVVINDETFNVDSVDPAKSWIVSVRAVVSKS